MSRQNVVEDIAKAIRELEPETDEAFEPLGQGVAEDYAVIRGPAMAELVQLCRQCQGLPRDVQAAADGWWEKLNPERMSAYCSAISGLIENALLSSGDPGASGRIFDLERSPRFQLLARPGSLLAREAQLPTGGSVEYGVAELARHIARRCAESPADGELAWRCIARSLPRVADVVFPGIDVEFIDDQQVLVVVRPLQLGEPVRSS